MKNCVVVIPIYKDVPAREECASVRQTFRVLGRHDIVFVTHAGCRLDAYREIVEAERGTLRTELFDASYFDSTAHYSDLCFSEEFYLRFEDYEYMLICQTDAWVFRDELDYWCGRGYDYIGAPIYFPYNKKRFTHIFYGIGNGGFCLRKRLGLLPLFIAKVFGFRNTIAQFRKSGCEEDAILSFWAHNAWGLTCRVPDELEAAHFSIEVHPEYLFNKMGRKLPFGCHAFGKWDYESFWKKHIEI